MTRPRIRNLLTAMLLVWGVHGGAPAAVASEFVGSSSFAPKLGLRMGIGALQNLGSASTGVAYRGFDIAASYYLTPKVSLGLGYFVDSPFSGLRAFGRYYFKGLGTRTRLARPAMVSELQDGLAYYAGLDITQRSYSYAIKKTSDGIRGETLTGSSGALSALIGVDRRLTHNFEMNLECNVGTLRLFSSHDQIKILGYVLYAGFAYLW